MSHFDLLHPALQHHIVNSLGWRQLRPFQEQVIPPILAGEHAIVLAPTAGGKTEAAFFPVLSRMLSEEWAGLSVLYICPIKALLNNLDTRLERYATLLGRRSTLWHGDVGASDRRKILRDPPDCLLTTPESLEVMLDSQSVDSMALLANVRAVIVDEIHAFAGDDRGCHLLAVLSRLSHLAGREIQRIGLSATVGNPEALVDWLAGSCPGPRQIFLPPAGLAPPADVTLDHVGSLENAAILISRLHRGEKRLVFIDSRARAELLAASLRALQVTTFVTHSSLSQEQRRQAEDAFANRDDCVIVATSVLELGVDVGDLDRVIQIDAPHRVSGFLQRMGRTGRRAGTRRNCLFLATDDDALIQAAGLIDLWQTGYVEPVEPPTIPYHVYAQQLMGLVLQQGGIPVDEIDRWLDGCRAFVGIDSAARAEILAHMQREGILFQDGGILGFGPRGEELYGRRNFLELFSVFLAPPLFTIRHGRQELGSVDVTTFLSKKDGPRVLLLGGRSWLVQHIDWTRKIAHVEPTEHQGRSRWLGDGAPLGFALCQSIEAVLAGDEVRECWSRRAVERLREKRHDYAWLRCGSTTLLMGPKGQPEWWTFGGLAANATLVGGLSSLIPSDARPGNFKVTFDEGAELSALEAAIRALPDLDPGLLQPAIDPRARESLKFTDCVPPERIQHELEARLRDPDSARTLMARPLRVVPSV